jgi:hypothetical protein
MMIDKKTVNDYQESMETADVRMSLVARKGSTIIELMKGGLTPTRAAEVAEVSKNTVSNWIKRGLTEQRRLEQGGEPDPNEKIYMDFALGALKAESEAQSGLVLAWFKEARQGDWKAAERFLAKRWPQEWGDNNTVKLEVSAMGMQADVPTPQLQEEDDLKKRAVLAALVEAGDLPSNVLSAWDKDDVIDAEVVENDE